MHEAGYGINISVLTNLQIFHGILSCENSTRMSVGESLQRLTEYLTATGKFLLLALLLRRRWELVPMDPYTVELLHVSISKLPLK